MRTALIVFAVYAILLTVGVFGSERRMADSLERELSRKVSVALEAKPVSHLHTLFSGIVAEGIDARIRSEQIVSHPQGMLSVATISACNPRISACF